MARRVAGAMQHLEFDVAEMHLVAGLEPAIRFETEHVRETEHLALLRHADDPEAIFLMRPLDSHAGLRRQRAHPAGMVDVAVSDEDLGQHQLFLLEKFEDAIDIAAGVDDRRLAGLFAPENSAILLEGSNRNDGVAHGGSEFTEWRHYRTPPASGRLAAITDVGPVEQQLRHLVGHEDQRQQKHYQRRRDPRQEPAPLRFHAVAPACRAKGFSLIGHEQIAASTERPMDSPQASR